MTEKERKKNNDITIKKKNLPSIIKLRLMDGEYPVGGTRG